MDRVWEIVLRVGLALLMHALKKHSLEFKPSSTVLYLGPSVSHPLDRLLSVSASGPQGDPSHGAVRGVHAD